MTTLRPYQQEFYDRIRHSLSAGHRRIMCVAPCGSGKSVIIQKIVESAALKNSTILLLVHRREIVDQLAERLRDYKNVQVLMMQTAVRRLGIMSRPDIIIIDEAHTAMASSYRKILDHFSDSYALYFTATPRRTSGEGFHDIADDIVESVSVRWLIDNGYLADYHYYAPATLLDVAKLNTINGEYSGLQAAQALDKPKIYGDVLKCYHKYAEGLKTIVYCASVEHSKKTAAAFNADGIPAAHIDGKTDKQERADIIKKFRSGEITVLTNYSLVAEGFDVPDAGCVILLRPTQSMIFHVQSSMRAMRTAPGKDHCVILDMVGNYARHGLPDDDRQWSLDGQKKRKSNQKNSVIARTCELCFRTYSGNGRVCPYCGMEQHKTREEIEQDEKAELERIKIAERKERRIEVGMAKTREELERIARERNYAPGWVWHRLKIIEGRKKRG